MNPLDYLVIIIPSVMVGLVVFIWKEWKKLSIILKVFLVCLIFFEASAAQNITVLDDKPIVFPNALPEAGNMLTGWVDQVLGWPPEYEEFLNMTMNSTELIA